MPTCVPTNRDIGLHVVRDCTEKADIARCQRQTVSEKHTEADRYNERNIDEEKE